MHEIVQFNYSLLRSIFSHTKDLNRNNIKKNMFINSEKKNNSNNLNNLICMES